MIKQLNRYNYLAEQLNEKIIKPGELKGFSKSVKKFADKLQLPLPILDEMAEIWRAMEENIDPIIASGNYERLNILKSNINLFDSLIEHLNLGQNLPDTFSYSNGLKTRERINVLLVSSHSAGKTTFAKRLLGVPAGATGSKPSTGCLVIHKNDNRASLEILFNNEIHTKNPDLFEQFLRNRKIRIEKTRKSNNAFVLEYERMFRIDPIEYGWSDTEILSFLEEADSFPEAFEEIIWHHKRDKKSAFLDFANLYDMPGFGEDKHKKIIERVFEKLKPDVILYLLDTDRSIPSESEGEIEGLAKFLPIILQHNPQPLFCWLYQKLNNPSDVDSYEFLFGKKDDKEIKGVKESLDIFLRRVINADSFIKEIVEKIEITSDEDIKEKLKEELRLSNAENHKSRFSKECFEYLSKSFILDARGNETDIEVAQNAVSLVLEKYCATRASDFYKIAQNILKSLADTKLQIPDDLTSVIEKIEHNPDLPVIDANQIFFDSFCINKNEDLSLYYDINENLDFLKRYIIFAVDEIIDIFKARWGKSNTIDVKKLGKKFVEEYNKRPLWQDLMNYVYAYHKLKSIYDITPKYVIDVAYSILDIINNNINRLEEINKKFPLLVKMDDKKSIDV